MILDKKYYEAKGRWEAAWSWPVNAVLGLLAAKRTAKFSVKSQRGWPALRTKNFDSGAMSKAQAVCPTGALKLEKQIPILDLARCSQCGHCIEAAPELLDWGQAPLAFHGEQELLVPLFRSVE